MDTLFQLNDGFRILRRALKVHLLGIKKYRGNVKQISEKIIDSCYNKKKNYFMVSSGHFRQFYARDFGMILDSLIYLGYKERVRKTLIYAMDCYVKAGRITTQISPRGKAFDFPNHTPESTAYMLRSLITLNDKDLLKKYKGFIEKQIQLIFENDIDKETGLLRKDKHFSSMKDHSLRVSDCYLNSMLGLLSDSLTKAKYYNPFSAYDYEKILIENFWKEDHFIEDLSGREILSGDANVFPFWTGVIKNKEMLRKAISSVRKKELDSPFPLKYTTKEDVPKKFHLANLFVYGYEHDTVWVHLAMCYLKIVEREVQNTSGVLNEASKQKEDKELLKIYLKQYESKIKEHKNFLEVYFADGKPFKRSFYVVDDSMSWVAVFLELYNKYM